MGNNSRIRINLVRKRFNFRNNKINKKVVILGSVIMVALLAIIVGINISHDKSVAVVSIYDGDKEAVNIYDDTKKYDGDNSVCEEENNTSPKKASVSKEVKLSVLGEMMMGGDVTINNSYLYNSAFKKITTFTRDADLTYTSLSTNITNLDIIEDAKSKYLVTRNITSAITTLGVDIVNVASDHMTDYSKDIFNNTLSILKENNTSVAGLNDSILYVEKNNKKIAIVAATNTFIGIKNDYTDYGINAYDEKKMKSDIATASENADIVIVDIHWGRENTYGVTKEMQKIAYSAIDSGADLVMGSHALGIYPIITYKSVPIIYSTGYVMTDSDNDLAKRSYIFNIDINEENKIKTLEMIPIYINENKEAMPFYEYNNELASDFNTQLNDWNEKNDLDSKIVDNKIVVNFK